MGAGHDQQGVHSQTFDRSRLLSAILVATLATLTIGCGMVHSPVGDLPGRLGQHYKDEAQRKRVAKDPFPTAAQAGLAR